jgi:hypothetical protein
MAINTTHKPTEEACIDLIRKVVKNQRYRLKKQYFNGVPANEIRTTSPVDFMTDEEWMDLVKKWSDPKNMVCSLFHLTFLYRFANDLIILNIVWFHFGTLLFL